jgi:quinolinate synthase
LGNYINSITNRNMVLWDGACHVHEQFSLEKIVELKKQYPEAKLLVHPECKRQVVLLADKVGSTAALLNYAKQSDSRQFIVATESGIIHQMQKACPEKEFIAAPPIDSTCGCNDCNFMKLNTLEKLRDCLKNESPAIEVDPAVADKARRPIEKMLDISAKLGL